MCRTLGLCATIDGINSRNTRKKCFCSSYVYFAHFSGAIGGAAAGGAAATSGAIVGGAAAGAATGAGAAAAVTSGAAGASGVATGVATGAALTQPDWLVGPWCSGGSTARCRHV